MEKNKGGNTISHPQKPGKKNSSKYFNGKVSVTMGDTCGSLRYTCISISE